MPQVKVWNDHEFEHVEKFKSEEIRIPAGGFVTMDYFDAVAFQGQFTGLRMLGPNNPDPRGFKKIRVEEPGEPVVKEDAANVFHATGKKFESTAEMIEFAKAYAQANADLAVKDPDLEKAPAAESPVVRDLKAEIAELRAMLQEQAGRKKPGPKPKAKIA